MEKSFFEANHCRRSVRKYDPNKPLDKREVQKCIHEATLAPSSSNLQLWEFYHITNQKILKKISKACFGQSAASTALQLVVTVVRKDLWKKRAAANLKFLTDHFKDLKIRNEKREQRTIQYYQKLIPTLYREFMGIQGLIKKIIVTVTGIFRPMYREVSAGDLRVVAHKSTALAAQNFLIAMASKGIDTCPMEGFDSMRVKQILGLPKKAEISMIIGCGYRDEAGIHGPQFRVPFEEVYQEV